MINRIFNRGDLKKVSLNINLLFKPTHQGKYHVDNPSKTNNFPIDGEFGFVELMTDTNGEFAFQKVDIYSENINAASSYNITGYTNPDKLYKFTRSGKVTNGIIYWGEWGLIHSFKIRESLLQLGLDVDHPDPAIDAELKSAGGFYGWMYNNLIEKIGEHYDNDSTNPNTGNIFGGRDTYYYVGEGKVPSLDFMSSNSKYQPRSLTSKTTFTKDNINRISILNMVADNFAFRYLGKVYYEKDMNISPLPSDYTKRDKWIFLNNSKGRDKFIVSKSDDYINGYFIKDIGIPIFIPGTDKDCIGILKVFTVPRNTYYNFSDITSITDAVLNRAISPGTYDSGINTIKSFTTKEKVSRYYVYTQYSEDPTKNKTYTQYVEDIYDLDGDMRYPIEEFMVDNTNILNNNNVIPYGWYDISSTYNLPSSH